MGELLPFLTDIARLAWPTLLWMFAIETRMIHNGFALRRFGDFLLAAAVTSTWLALVYFDTRFNVVPWADLAGVSRILNLPFYVVLIVTLARCRSALRQAGGGLSGGVHDG